MMVLSNNDTGWLCSGPLLSAFGMRLAIFTGADYDHQAQFYTIAGGTPLRIGQNRRRTRRCVSLQANPVRCAVSGRWVDGCGGTPYRRELVAGVRPASFR